MRSISPLRYPGGKTQVYEFVRELIELNGSTTYIEPYMGGMGIALKLILDNKVDKIMVNDYDKSIYAFWYSVLNYTDNLIHLIETTPISIEEWKNQRRIQDNKNSSKDLLALGFSTLFLNRTNRSGIIKAGVIGGLQQNGNYKLDCRFNKERIIQNIKLIASMREKIKLYNMDAEKFIRLNISKTKNSFTFFDPPYYAKGPGLYTNFYNHEDHVSLSRTIKKHLKSKNWILTYDVVPEIFQMYNEFRNEKYYLNYSVTKPSKGIEYIFYSDMLDLPQNTINLKKAK
ncbi:DNA adenine methylase [Streptococcus parasanguinis]|jgi:DNA-methyltransferase|uniref:DNA adenine methylase n=1 Tax=Streptococcus parasanguinis TaxID=1318 RepID=UPI001D06739B|nr:DNA adenine methylase [Streptococcus parasanguinis]MCB6703729.1 DNA adenine methylase [Streptococcus parasanguinis]MCB6737869.1 DNA adenine methylase [Streptococcus parasanguinis]MCB7322386.1 DNA adenine methylase [Streptococcus parasanguinis]MCB7401794.1 DNA adenine methylase [Streptococcus parasanguinis]